MNGVCVSPGVDNVLRALDPGRQPEGRRSFPPRLPRDAARYTDSHGSTREWFREAVDAHVPDQQVARWAVEDNIFIFAVVEWEGYSSISFARLQAVVVNGGDVEDLYLLEPGHEDELDVQYLRLDFDLQNPGRIFKDPQPHLHSRPLHEPRFGLPTDGNVVVGFLDLIYRNYKHEAWLGWAERVWSRRGGFGPENDPLPAIVAAFESGETGILRDQFSDHLGRLKNLLREEADGYPLRVEPAWADLLTFAL